MTPTIIPNLLHQFETVADSTISRTIQSDDATKTVLFAFGAGQELSEHTASMPAIIQLVKGEATITVGEQTVEAVPGTWIHMPAQLPHSVRATTDTIMILILVKAAKPRAATASS
ncbi:MAG: cupin domain-containing protein [Chthonomonas sp.]|nr:cupin domain-containing protein [Chthonomonas sp.]